LPDDWLGPNPKAIITGRSITSSMPRAGSALIAAFQFSFFKNKFSERARDGVPMNGAGCDSVCCFRVYQKPSQGTAVPFVEIINIFEACLSVP
jgi:hypothetical protein